MSRNPNTGANRMGREYILPLLISAIVYFFATLPAFAQVPGCTAAQMADNGSFSISGANLVAPSPLSAARDYSVCVVDAMSGVTNSGAGWPLTIHVTAPVGPAITVNGQPSGASVSSGAAMTVAVTGGPIAGEAASSWIGVCSGTPSPANCDGGGYSWDYLNCTQTPPSSIVPTPISCSIPAPSIVGSYTANWFPTGSSYVAAVSAPFSVQGGGPTITVNGQPSGAVVSPGNSMTVAIGSGPITGQDATSWIGICTSGALSQATCDGAGYQWMYLNCSTQTPPGSTINSASCPMTSPSTAGAYQVGWFPNGAPGVSGGGAVTIAQSDKTFLTGSGTSCSWTHSRPIQTGNTVVGFTHTSNSTDTAENKPTTVTDNAGNTYNLITPIHWAPYAEDIGMWYLVNVQGNPTTFTFSGFSATPVCRIGFTEYSGATGVITTGPISSGAADPSITISPTASSSLLWVMAAQNTTDSNPCSLSSGQGAIETSGYSVLIDYCASAGLGAWGSNTTVGAGPHTIAWNNETYYNASACSDGSTSGGSCPTVMEAVAVSGGASLPPPASITVNGATSGTSVTPGAPIAVAVSNGPLPGQTVASAVNVCTTATPSPSTCGGGGGFTWAFLGNPCSTTTEPSTVQNSATCTLTAPSTPGNYTAYWFPVGTPSPTNAISAPFTVGCALTGQLATDAANKGFTTCARYDDFTTSTINIACSSGTTSGFEWYWGKNFINYATPAGPCVSGASANSGNSLIFSTTDQGGTVLDLRSPPGYATTFTSTSYNDTNSAPNPGLFPNGAYEITFRLDNPSALPALGTSMWSYIPGVEQIRNGAGCNPCTHNGFEIDFMEGGANGTDQGAGWDSSAIMWGDAGGVTTSSRVSSGNTDTSYHTWGGLWLSDGGGNTQYCSYYDGARLGCSGVLPYADAGDRNERRELIIWNNIPVTSTVNMYIKNIKVITCSTWQDASSSGMCNTSTSVP